MKITKRPGENETQMFRRFRKRVMRSGILSSIRKKRWYISKGEQKRIEKKKGIRRAQKRQSRRSR